MTPSETIADTNVVYFFGTVKDDETGKGLSDAIIHFGEYTSKTGIDGEYEFKFMPEGTYAIWIEKPGYCSTTEKVVKFGSGVGKTAHVCLRKKQ